MAHVSIETKGNEVTVSVLHPRIDGENHIINEIRRSECFRPETLKVEINFEPVRYINSLGISEIINIHRLFNEVTGENSRLIFCNVDPKVLSILELIEIHKIVEIRPAVSPGS